MPAAAPTAPLGPPDEPRTRILEAALEAIGSCGLRKLGMLDVARAAGVSRGTLYRYFDSKDELLSSLVEYERQRFQRRVNELLATVPPGPGRVQAHVGFVLDYLRHHPALAGLIDTEPRYLLGFLAAHLDSFRHATSVMLEPVLADAPVVRRGDATLESLADMFCRVLLSYFLFPPHAASEAASLAAVATVARELARATPRAEPV